MSSSKSINRGKVIDMRRRTLIHEMVQLGAEPMVMLFCLSEIGLPCGKSTVTGWTHGGGRGRNKFPPKLDVRQMELVAAMRLVRKMCLLDIVRVTGLHINAVYNFIEIDMKIQTWSVAQCHGCDSLVVFDKGKGYSYCPLCQMAEQNAVANDA